MQTIVIGIASKIEIDGNSWSVKYEPIEFKIKSELMTISIGRILNRFFCALKIEEARERLSRILCVAS